MTEPNPNAAPMAAITAAELEQWRELCEKATAGPWKGWEYLGEDEQWHSIGPFYAPGETMGPDDLFIAAARSAMPRLIDSNEHLLAEVERLQHELAAYQRAKAENDERFMIERDEARAEVERLRAELAQREAGPGVG